MSEERSLRSTPEPEDGLRPLDDDEDDRRLVILYFDNNTCLSFVNIVFVLRRSTLSLCKN